MNINNTMNIKYLVVPPFFLLSVQHYMLCIPIMPPGPPTYVSTLPICFSCLLKQHWFFLNNTQMHTMKYVFSPLFHSSCQIHQNLRTVANVTWFSGSWNLEMAPICQAFPVSNLAFVSLSHALSASVFTITLCQRNSHYPHWTRERGHSEKTRDFPAHMVRTQGSLI